MAVEVEIDLITRQARANADALADSVLGISSKVNLAQAAIDAASKAIEIMASVIGQTTGEAIKFEKALTDIKTIAPATDMEALGKSLLEVSSAWGVDKLVAVNAQYDIMSSGVTDAGEAFKVMEAAAKLATATGAQTSETAKTITAAMNAWGMKASDVGQIMDSLAITTQDGVIRMTELGPVFGQIAATAAGAGVSLQELNAGVAALTLGGAPAAQAGTQLNSVIVELLKPSEALAKAFEAQAGQSSAAYLKANGLAKTLDVLKIVTKGSAEEMSKLFGQQTAVAGLLPLVTSQSENFTKSLDKQNASITKNGAATEEMARIVSESADFRLKQLSSTVDALATQFGATFVPAIAEGAKILTEFAKSLQDLFEENKATFKAMGEDLKNFIRETGEFAKSVKNSDEYKVALLALKEVAVFSFTTISDAIKGLKRDTEAAFTGMGISIEEYKSLVNGVKIAIQAAVKSMVLQWEVAIRAVVLVAEGVMKLGSLLTSFQKTVFGFTGAYEKASTATADFNQKLIDQENALKMGKAAFNGAGVTEFKADLEAAAKATEATTETIKKNTVAVIENKKLTKEQIDAAKKAAEAAKKAAEEEAKFKYELFRDEQAAEAFNNEQIIKLQEDLAKQQLDATKKAAEDEAKFKYELFIDEQNAEAFNNEQLLKLQDDLIKEQKKKTEEWYSNTIGTIKGLASALSSITSAFANTDPVIVQAELEKIPTEVVDPVAAVEEETKAKLESIQKVATESTKAIEEKNAKEKAAIEDEYAAKIEAFKRAQELVDAANKDDISSKKESLKASLESLKAYYAEVDAKEKDAGIKRTAQEKLAIKKQRELEYDNFSAGNNLRNETLTATQQALAKQQREDIVKNLEIERDGKIKVLETVAKKQKQDSDKILEDEKKAADDKVKASKKAAEEAKKQAKIDEVNAKNNAALAKAAAANAKATAEADKKKLEAASKVAGAIGDQLSKIPGIVGMVGGLIAGIVSVVFQLPEIIRGLPNMVKGFLDAIPLLFKELGKAFGEAIGPLMQLAFKFFFSVDFWVEIISSFINALGDGIMGFVNGVGGMIAELFGSKIWDGIGNAFQSAGNWLADVGSSIWAGVKGAGEAAGDWLASLGSQIWEGLKAMGNAIGDFFANAGSSIWAGFSALFETIWAWFKDIGARIWGGLKDAVGDVVATFGKWGKSIWDGFTTVVKDIAAWFAEKGSAIWNGFVAALKAIGDFFGDLGRGIWNGLWEGIKGLGEWLYKAGQRIWDGLKSVFSFGYFSSGGGVGTNPAPYAGPGGVGGHQTPLLSRASGGPIPGTAKMPGDSRQNDTVLALLSPGELVIPRSAVGNGLPGIMAFAREAMGMSTSSMPRFAAGGLAGASGAGANFSLDGMIEEMRYLRSEVNSIGYALAKNSVLTRDILERWEGSGLPMERDF